LFLLISVEQRRISRENLGKSCVTYVSSLGAPDDIVERKILSEDADGHEQIRKLQTLPQRQTGWDEQVEFGPLKSKTSLKRFIKINTIHPAASNSVVRSPPTISLRYNANLAIPAPDFQ
jgi:hypothetical protein